VQQRVLGNFRALRIRVSHTFLGDLMQPASVRGWDFLQRQNSQMETKRSNRTQTKITPTTYLLTVGLEDCVGRGVKSSQHLAAILTDTHMLINLTVICPEKKVLP